MSPEQKMRFSAAPWAGKAQDIIIGGAGGISSWLSLALARAGHNLYVYDMDTYENQNIAGQFCKTSDVGKKKTVALKENIKAFTDSNISAMDKYESNSMVAPIMMCGFDNMEARKLMFEKWKAEDDRLLFIDGRMTAEVFNVFVVQKGQEDRYEETLFPSSEANELPCSFKSTTHNAMGIAYMMTSALNNFLAQDVDPVRELPFQIDANVALFMFDVTD